MSAPEKRALKLKDAKLLLARRVEAVRRVLNGYLRFRNEPHTLVQWIAEERKRIALCEEKIARFEKWQEEGPQKILELSKQLKDLNAKLEKMGDPRIAKIERLKAQLAQLQAQGVDDALVKQFIKTQGV